MALENKLAHLWYRFSRSTKSVNMLPPEGMMTLKGVLGASSSDLGEEQASDGCDKGTY